MPVDPNDQPTEDLKPSAGGSGGTTERFARALGGGESPGDEIGPYKLISQIGEGGFGTVWLAERRQPFVQRVALKLIKAGMDSKSVLARFEQERQALAVMNHPGIARVLDGGITPSGRPYFAMEYVKGEPVTQFCDRVKLGIEERLKLFEQACEAIQHAHLKGMVHRDLKPGNVLAFMVEGEGPKLKVIDFGVAKAMGQRMTEHTIFTETGQMIGTPEYMSPEQADPDATDIDTRSDVYSLGVLLYQLLTGVLPFDPRELRSKAQREIQRIIREVDPPTPSARLSTIAAKDSELASRLQKARGVAVAELARELRSELEWIPLKAIRKDREERYERPVDLARDIENYLAGRPLVAAPESKAYRARKWMRRNRTAVRVALVGVVMLGLGVSIPPLKARWDDMREVARMNAFEVLAQEPDPAVVTDADARERIKGTGKPWKIRHTVSGIVMLLVPPGEFLMGSPKTEKGREDDEAQRKRVIGKAFYLSQQEVSKAEWRAIAGNKRGEFKGDALPVESVSWNNIREDFLAHSRGFFRLPSEAEWEYACRAGTTTAYSFGDTITKKQVCFGSDRPVACGSLPANPWGFHEMHGNVFELVEDSYLTGTTSRRGQEAVKGNASTPRVLRGGSWYNDSADVRSSSRNSISPEVAVFIIGFRVARAPL